MGIWEFLIVLAFTIPTTAENDIYLCFYPFPATVSAYSKQYYSHKNRIKKNLISLICSFPMGLFNIRQK
jgi:hypothetical protein